MGYQYRAPVQHIARHTSTVNSVAFSPNGRTWPAAVSTGRSAYGMFRPHQLNTLQPQPAQSEQSPSVLIAMSWQAPVTTGRCACGMFRPDDS